MSTFFLRKPKGNTKTLVLFSAYFKDEGRKFVYSTGETILPKDWDFENKQPTNLNGRTTSAKNKRSIKIQLDRYSTFFVEITSRYTNSKQEITIANIKKEFDKEFQKVHKSKNPFFDAYAEFMIYKQKNKHWKSTTTKRYKNIENLLKDFQTDKKYKLTFNTITDEFYTEFTDYCMTTKKHINNTFSRNVGLFKTFMLWSLKNKHTYKTDFIEFKKKKRVVTEQIALTIQDIETILNHDYNNYKLEKVRDIFVFACVTGLRFGEMKHISKHNTTSTTLTLKEDKEADKDERKIPLNNIANHILWKYDYNLPLMANQKHNEYIKEVFRLAGYTQTVEKNTTSGKDIIREQMPFHDRISTHTARRTFITLMKDKGIADKVIAEITGHRDMKTLNQYYQVTSKSTYKAVAETFKIEIPLKKVL